MQSIRIEIIPSRDEAVAADQSAPTVAKTFDDPKAAIKYLESLYDPKAAKAARDEADAAVEKARSDLAAAEKARADLAVSEAKTAEKPKAAGDGTSAVTAPSGTLPDDFPAIEKLRAAGVTTFAKVRKLAADDELTTIEGIGPVAAEKIAEALE